MTKAEKVLKYLERCTHPKTQEQIAKGAKVNPNTLRRVMCELYSGGMVVEWPDAGGKFIAYTAVV